MHPDQNGTGEDGMSPLASVMSGMPEVFDRLIEEHVSDSSGRCMVCRNHGTAGAPWPCTLRVIAEDARTLRAAELSGPCGLAS